MEEDLFRKIENGARNARIPEVEFARRLLRSGKVTVKQEIVADVPQLKRIIAELGKIGSNINQIAHHLNAGGEQSSALYARTQSALAAVFDIKRDVESMGGDFRGYSQARLNKKQ